MKDLIIKECYKPFESYEKTQQAIKLVKDFFQQELAYRLKLQRVTAPLFVTTKSGLNDNLSGVERVVSFTVKDLDEENAEIVQSLAKWKRMALGKFKVEPHRGIYTDMNAIRRDEKLDNLHSIYVDQWDWEKVITGSDRTSEYLRSTVKILYECFKNLEEYVNNLYPDLVLMMPDDIFFITSEELLKMYPDIPALQREYEIVKKKRAVFIEKIGGKLSDGTVHDGRAPDYDDWELNGDIILWSDMLDAPMEISSMGVRVDEKSMLNQLKAAKKEERAELEFHKKVLNGELPLTIGGGIGQSRLCLYFLKRMHIGEVQVGIWQDEVIEKCSQAGIMLL